MPSPIDRRKFLQSAGATAAGGIVLGVAGSIGSPGRAEAAPAAVSIRPDDIIFLDETIQIGIADFHAVGSGNHVAFSTADVVNYPALIYADGGTSAMLMARVPVAYDATLDSVVAHVRGNGGQITVEVWQQDFSSSANYGKFVGNVPVARQVGATNAATIMATLGTGTASGANTQFHVRVTGTTSVYGLAGVTANYKSAAATGFHPVGPTRVYDSRDAGSGGPITSGQTRDVSIANGTAFGGGTANVVPDGTRTITYNLTVTDGAANGYLAIYAKGGKFAASAINWTASEDVANGGVVNVSPDRMVTVLAGGGGTCNFIIDVTGYYN